MRDWDVSSVTDMHRIFYGAKSFNADISKWDVSRVTSMERMLSDVRSFAGDISKWDVSSVINMEEMFAFVDSFNGDISKWDVSRVVSMEAMFYYAGLFNADISKWDVSSVINMNFMFFAAASFTRVLCSASWLNSRQKASQRNMFAESSGKIANSLCTPTGLCLVYIVRSTHRAAPSIITDSTVICCPNPVISCVLANQPQ